MQPNFPLPDADALAHSAQLAAGLRDEITRQGGAIPFSRFMELCLYTPGWGYYSAGASKFGASGDFTTAPEMGSLFASTVANALAPVFQQLQGPARLLELGGGSGAFAEAVLLRLAELQALPARYAILEPSADLRERQQQRLRQNLPEALASRVEWLDRPFDDDWEGVVFANEVIDALPTPRFLIKDGEVYEETVELDAQGGFVRGAQPADMLLHQAVRHLERYLKRPFADGYRSELLPQLPYWLQAVAGGLQRGALLFVDYGYNRAEFYQPERDDGTLRAFYRHHVHNEVHLWPGLQDITASVDFTAMAEAGLHAGFDLAGYCSQASFLLGNGLDQCLALADERTDDVGRVQLRDQLKKLTLPSGMGERFQVIGLQREVDFEPAFELGDLSWRL
ncbi:SAM-dependent methyltransferase [Stenotrophomonas sp. C3(2023)]|uniref:class I SAM-dependent methyltransferase n=1 Tax=Stenotrophomonas sp. C3(2023) TaxID=3080277 RepID=UPI00293CF2C2|nr:SAM-dependent methyltransferase [Stenotrophomonas sp. C3(2023)]MDV3467529.1 SAM-dependent methyltransferase [Stenotrophomonas sp. C3(2023)]